MKQYEFLADWGLFADRSKFFTETKKSFLSKVNRGQIVLLGMEKNLTKKRFTS
jgi:hypothetical protein